MHTRQGPGKGLDFHHGGVRSRDGRGSERKGASGFSPYSSNTSERAHWDGIGPRDVDFQGRKLYVHENIRLLLRQVLAPLGIAWRNSPNFTDRNLNCGLGDLSLSYFVAVRCHHIFLQGHSRISLFVARSSKAAMNITLSVVASMDSYR